MGVELHVCVRTDIFTNSRPLHSTLGLIVTQKEYGCRRNDSLSYCMYLFKTGEDVSKKTDWDVQSLKLLASP